MSIGINIALSGLVVFLFLLLLSVITNGVKLDDGIRAFLGFLVIISLVSMPLGLIIKIWAGE